MKLVDLALVSPKKVFDEIVGLLATISHETLYAESNIIHNAVSAKATNKNSALNYFFFFLADFSS